MLSIEALARHAKQHRILAGIGANLISEVARAALLPVIAIVAARYLGVDRYGVFATGQVLTAFCATFAGFGLLYAILQLGSRREETLSTLLSNSIVGALLTAAVAYGGLAGWVYLFDYSHTTQIVVLVMGSALFPMALNAQLQAALQVQGRYTLMAVAGVVAAVANVVYALAVVVGDRGLTALALSPVVASMAMASFTAWALRSELTHRVSITRLRDLFKTGFLFGLGDFFYFIYFSIDLVMLSLLVGERSVGLYNIPVRMLVVAYLLPMVVFNRVLYPRYFEWSRTDRERLRQTYVLTSKGMMFIGMLAAAGLVLVADPLVPAVFRDSFSESAVLLQILALALPLRYISGSASAVLATSDQIGQRVRIQAATAALNVALCLVMIPLWEARGAAIATVITEAFLAVAQVLVVRAQVLDADLAREARAWLFVLPYSALILATIAHQSHWIVALSGLVAIVSLAAIGGPLKYFEGLSLPLMSRPPAEPERASLA
jgi:O-antigen/teichoic acid export membrane protein